MTRLRRREPANLVGDVELDLDVVGLADDALAQEGEAFLLGAVPVAAVLRGRRQLMMTGLGLAASSSPRSGALPKRSSRTSSRSHCRAALSMSARARRRDS